jgi:HEAT repeat protein
VRSLAIQCVGSFGKEAEPAVPSLVRCLADEAVEVRLVAVEALGRLGSVARGALSALKETEKNDSRAEVRDAAAEALKKIEGPS